MTILRCDLPPEDFLIWRHPEKSQVFGSQIIVSQTQEAVVLASGELVSVLPPGAHTLKTANIPVLKNFIQDGENSFPFDIWFVNKVSSTNFKWGTKSPIQIKDNNYGLLIPLGSYGSYECVIKDFQSFLLRVVGTRYKYSIDDLKDYLLPLVERETKDAIAEEASSKDVFNISTELNEISEKIKTNLKEKFYIYGLNLRDFYVQSVSILSTDKSFEKLKEAIAESASIRMKAKAIEASEAGYKTERTLDVLEKLAGNEGGAASAFAGAGLGLGAGLNVGNKFMEMSDSSAKKENTKSAVDRLKDLKELLDLGAISQEEYDSKKKSILDEL
jgi:membrane protease subunit (stomatin/prohibitin family)